MILAVLASQLLLFVLCFKYARKHFLLISFFFFVFVSLLFVLPYFTFLAWRHVLYIGTYMGGKACVI